MTTLQQIPQRPRLSDLAVVAQGVLHGADQAFAGVGIDARRLAAGEVFFALHGERADGHAHIGQAAEAGAPGAVVEQVADTSIAQIEVSNTQQALQTAGAAWRALFDGPVVGITGSNGKTTVRRMVTAVLAEQLGPVLASTGNFNNHLGVPLTLLGLRHNHASAVIEMGANHIGEIEVLAGWARPTIGVITNAGDAHLEGFGSRDGVARGKGELYEQLRADGVAVINADDAYAGQWRETAAHCRRLCFSLDDNSADVSAHGAEITAAGSRFVLATQAGQVPVHLALPGQHNIRNALAAAAVAVALDVPLEAIASGLARVQPTPGRLEQLPGRFGARIVDDSYNANPVSLATALDWLAQQPGPRWLVLGDMGELGETADQAHRRAGQQARDQGVQRLWATGEKSRLAVDEFGGDDWFGNHAQLGKQVAQALADNTSEPPIVLIKGSRAAHMDRIVALLVDEAAAGGASC